MSHTQYVQLNEIVHLVIMKIKNLLEIMNFGTFFHLFSIMNAKARGFRDFRKVLGRNVDSTGNRNSSMSCTHEIRVRILIGKCILLLACLHIYFRWFL